MSELQVAWNATTRVAKIQNEGDAVGAGFVDIGTFNHFDDADDELGDDGAVTSENHVFYHHVRDLLFAEGEENMQTVSILADKPEGLSIVIASATIAPAGTSQITPTWDPTTTVDKRIVYMSDDEAVATVDAAGLVTAVADGTANITATSVSDARLSDVVEVTVAS